MFVESPLRRTHQVIKPPNRRTATLPIQLQACIDTHVRFTSLYALVFAHIAAILVPKGWLNALCA